MGFLRQSSCRNPGPGHGPASGAIAGSTCSIATTATPRSIAARNASWTWAISCVVIPAIASSSNNTRGSSARARAISSSRCRPGDNISGMSLQFRRRPTSFNICAGRGQPPQRDGGRHSTRSRGPFPIRSGKKRDGSSETFAQCRLAHAADSACGPTIDCPSNFTSPVVGR